MDNSGQIHPKVQIIPTIFIIIYISALQRSLTIYALRSLRVHIMSTSRIIFSKISTDIRSQLCSSPASTKIFQSRSSFCFSQRTRNVRNCTPRIVLLWQLQTDLLPLASLKKPITRWADKLAATQEVRPDDLKNI